MNHGVGDELKGLSVGYSCRHVSSHMSAIAHDVGCWVARWFVFKPKIPIWVNFGGSCDGRCRYTYFMVIWSILWSSCIYYGFLIYVMVIWYTTPFW
jgi:hypothetical protein